MNTNRLFSTASRIFLRSIRSLPSGLRCLVGYFKQVQEAGADDFLTVKKNRSTQHADICRLMRPAPAGFPPEDKGRCRGPSHGRQEIRRLVRCRATGKQVIFPHAEQIAMVRRKSGKRNRETVCPITSCPPEKLTAKEWLQINRQSWGIENRLREYALAVSRIATSELAIARFLKCTQDILMNEGQAL